MTERPKNIGWATVAVMFGLAVVVFLPVLLFHAHGAGAVVYVTLAVLFAVIGVGGAVTEWRARNNRAIP